MSDFYVLNWNDRDGKRHQEEFVTPNHYDDGSRSWVHTWNNPEDGLKAFTSHCPMDEATIYQVSPDVLSYLRSKYIVIPEEELKRYKVNKWIFIYVVQENWGVYGNGWEDSTTELTYKEARKRLKEYRQCSKVPSRLIKRRVLNPLYGGNND